VLTVGCSTSPDTDAELRPASPQIFESGGSALSSASGTAARVVSDFLSVRGLRETRALQSPLTGITHVRLAQEVDGVPVYGTYVKAAMNDNGQLVHLIADVADLSSAAVQPARIAPGAAVSAAVGLHFEDGAAADAGYWVRPPTATDVVVPMADGSLQAGYLVETWAKESNLLYHTVFGADGRVVHVELRTNSDAYNIFPVSPEVGPQQLISGPGAGNEESPIGWLGAGSHSKHNISGNNAFAYLDTDANNAPDNLPGNDAVTDGVFDTAADLGSAPDTAGNRAVAVQNLFYLNNVIHDKLYRHGFVEAAGNFQENNFGNGGLASDAVLAEAQDGSGTDNANFATPSDGSNPRMQMFLWTGLGDHTVTVNAPAGIAGDYVAMGAEFGPALDVTGVTGDVVLVDDGSGVASDGCEAITNDLSGKTALIDRGTCAFTIKVKNAQNAGATAAIIANNAGDGILTMGGTDGTIAISSVLVGQSDGETIRGAAGVNATIKRSATQPLMRDGDIDSDIVYHEYGHGLTWRMIGSMSGAMSGAIGEGMSDVLAILINDNDVVGEYSFSNPGGIRSAPYAQHTVTYGGFTGSGVHLDGEIYAATIWRLWEIWQREGLSQDLLFDYLIEGMNFTPAGPAMEDMRDGILAAISDPAHECLVWEAFAAKGIGVGAEATLTGPNVSVTESFEMPESCGECTATENPEASCDDGSDNDCDGAVDCDDADCAGDPACEVCTITENPEASCDDGSDNDCDGAVDCDDSDCDGDPACGGGTCELGQKGDVCSADADCCSNRCRGKPGAKTCK
jgi:hypothetical protein